jgi:cytochrome o ubiquinol oxidase operon protein cyoD
MQTTHPENGHGLRSYLTGFALALLLTAIPFGLVMFGSLSKTLTLIAIATAAIVQVVVHLRFFLHLDLTTTPRENLLAIAFAAILILIMVGGSLWIMFDLHYRHRMDAAAVLPPSAAAQRGSGVAAPAARVTKIAATSRISPARTTRAMAA